MFSISKVPLRSRVLCLLKANSIALDHFLVIARTPLQLGAVSLRVLRFGDPARFSHHRS